jgi:hypothetical protein
MNSILLHIGRSSVWSPEAALLAHGATRSKSGQVMLESEDGWLSVTRDDDALNDYEDDDREVLDSLILNPVTYLIEWRGARPLHQFISLVPRGGDVVVDNDHGLICSVDQIREIPIASWVTLSKIV